MQFTETFLNYFGQGVLRETVLAAHKDTDPEADLEPVYGGELHRVLLERGILDSLSPLLRRDRLLTINTSGPLLSLGRGSATQSMHGLCGAGGCSTSWYHRAP